MATRPKALQRQGDGSKKQWSNCAAAAAANAALRALKNVNPKMGHPWLTTTLPTMSSAIRRWCDSHFNTTGIAGLYQRWVNAAIRSMYGVEMGYYWQDKDSNDEAWAVFRALVLAGRGTSVSITYSADLGTKHAAFSGFVGRHRVYVNERRYNATKDRYEFLVYDPGADGRHPWVPKGPEWWPAKLLREAMEASGIEVSYTRKTEG